MKKNLILLIIQLNVIGFQLLVAQQSSKWGDQGDGYFRNPVLPADFSDPDIIRVGNDYYGVSSTLQESPGMVVIHSTDLVNWEIKGHVIADIST
jgi:beta-xylosidase